MRRILVLGAAWAVAVLLMCIIASRGRPMVAGPVRMEQTLEMIGQLVAVIIGTLTLLLARAIRTHTSSLTDQINNVHHEGGEPPSMRELIVWTHQDSKETKELAWKNRELIGEVQAEQTRVRDRLNEVQEKNCPFHEENTTTIAEIKKRLGMEADADQARLPREG